jgi:carbamate kinase
VKRWFGTPAEEEIRGLRADEAEKLLIDLAEGSMRPKVEAAIAMARSGGEAIITSLGGVEDALAGRSGTRVAG